MKKNLRALLVLGIFMASLACIGGGYILWVGYSRQEVVQPMWKHGQAVMYMGLINLAIYSGIFWQVKRVAADSRNHSQ